jgi:hypothetical protein
MSRKITTKIRAGVRKAIPTLPEKTPGRFSTVLLQIQ